MKRKNINLIKDNKGITLMALVITIIVLIILAGISIKLLLGENGLIKKAQNTKETHTIEAIKEKLDIAKGSDYIEQKGDSSIDTYFAILEKEKIEPYKITNKQKMTDSIGNIEVDNKYSYIITIENNKNIKIEYEGKIGEIERKPDIVEIIITGEKEQDNLPVKLVANIKTNGIDVSSGKYVINNSSEELGTEDSVYTEQISNSNIEIKLEEVNSYYIHTLTLDKYGRKQETIKGPIQVTTKYHKHTGDDSLGGGCYTKETKEKITTTCSHKTVSSKLYPKGTFSGYYSYIFKYGAGSESSCTYTPSDVRIDTGYADGRDIGDVTYRHEIITGEKVVGYELACGKTETTIENYTISY